MPTHEIGSTQGMVESHAQRVYQLSEQQIEHLYEFVRLVLYGQSRAEGRRTDSPYVANLGMIRLPQERARIQKEETQTSKELIIQEVVKLLKISLTRLEISELAKGYIGSLFDLVGYVVEHVNQRNQESIVNHVE